MAIKSSYKIHLLLIYRDGHEFIDKKKMFFIERKDVLTVLKWKWNEYLPVHLHITGQNCILKELYKRHIVYKTSPS